MLHARYGSELHERLRASFERAGLAYNPPPEVVPNSRSALRVTELARARGRHEPVHERLMDAYWAEGRNIGDTRELLALAVEAGLDEDEAQRVLGSDEHADAVLASTAQAQSIGINGIPAFLLDWKVLVLGAQPREVFEQAFERLAAA